MLNGVVVDLLMIWDLFSQDGKGFIFRANCKYIVGFSTLCSTQEPLQYFPTPRGTVRVP
jgi:hypothetical protein